jgi:hypothetical protein
MYTLLLLLLFSLSQSQYVGPGSGGDQHPTTGARIDEGCHIDPNGGRCADGLAGGGGAMDPNGATSDDGPYIDPNGRRVSAAGDKGMGLDPNG